MSLITCCPACQTMFKVSGEDLRVSDGWVRCGNCEGVFDASAHLQVMPAQSQAAASPDSAPFSSRFDARATQGQAAEVEADSEPAASFPVAERASLFRSATVVDDLGSASLVQDVKGQDRPSVPTPAGNAVLRQEDRSARRKDNEPLEFLPSTGPSRSKAKVLLWGLGLLLVAVAFLGWARHERQALVQRMPALLGVFEKLCQTSGCDVQPPRLLQSVLIDGAVLEEAGPAQYKVQLVLRNTGGVALAVPALDVSLTGLQGEVLVRHTVLPSEFAPGLARLLPGAQQPVSFMVAGPVLAQAVDAPVAAPTAPVSAASAAGAMGAPSTASEITATPAADPVPAPSISGYRVIAFYP